jgi:HK97 family phage major capsid protein
MLSTEELLRKAILTETTAGGAETIGIGGSGQAPLSVEQVTQFIELMSAQQVMLSDVRTVTSNAAKWQESILNFADRIARPGVEATRLASGDRVKPSTGVVEISTVLLRGEVPVSDEVLEDNVAGQGLVQSLERTISDRFGFDIEDLFVNGDTSNGGDSYLAQIDGWLKQAQTSGNSVDGSTYGQDYQEIFRVLLNDMPLRFLRNLETDGRFYIPKRTEQKYRDILSSRGTPLGDIMLTGKNDLTYQGIKIVGVPSFGVTANKSSILLTNKNNLYAGFHRAMKFETWRDPREGATSFIVTARVDAEVAVPEATVIAHDVDVSA